MAKYKLDPNTITYQAAKNDLMERHCPRIYPCADCGYPVASGYCCTECGSREPSTPSANALPVRRIPAPPRVRGSLS